MENPENNPVGRPCKPIDWNRVDTMIAKGCSGVEIAGELGIHEETFYVRVQQEHNINFTGYAGGKYSKGNGRIRMMQFDRAMDGNIQMLIWLGKVRLNQKEPDSEDGKPTVPNEDFLRLQDELIKTKYELEKLKNEIQPQATPILQ